MYNILTKLAAGNGWGDDLKTPNNNNKDTTGVLKVGNEQNNLLSTITSIINGVIGILGIVCVVVMIIGGINYMTSSGDAGKVKKAKDTILYGLIGLVVCVLAFAIVNFLIMNILKGDAPT